MLLNKQNTKQIINLINNHKVGIMPTDTIYGIHCLVNIDTLVDRVYKIKNRPTYMPLISLISNMDQLDYFDLKIGSFEKDAMFKHWPGPNTLIFELNDGNTKSFRLPDNEFLQSIISQTGPLISTSANISGQPNCLNIKQAKDTFKDKVDFYVDGGILEANASNVYLIKNNSIEKIR